MELVSGINIFEGSVEATAISEGGAERQLSGIELVRFGLPEASGRTKKVRTDLSTWVRASLEEYSYAVGCPLTGQCSHAAWTFLHERSRYIVPALAIMRSLVSSDIAVFPRLFQPQSLDDLCGSIIDQGLQSIALIPQKARTRPLLALLSWLACHPSARQFWASARQNAVNGRLDLTLPKAVATFTVWESAGRLGRNCYVTGLRLDEIEPLEEPFEFASAHPRRICLYSDVNDSKDVSGERIAALEGLRASAFAISDEAWAVAEPILRTTRGRPLDVRRRLSCVVHKLTTGVTWWEAGQRHQVKGPTAAGSFAIWSQDGRWAKLQAAFPDLNQMLTLQGN